MTRIKEILNERNVTLKDFAKMLGITYTALYQQIDKPSYPTLVKWGNVLNVPLWQLFASPDEVRSDSAQPDFAAYIRSNGKVFLPNNLQELTDVVKKLNEENGKQKSKD